MEWIKTSDALPEDNKNCLCVSTWMNHTMVHILTFRKKFREWEGMKYKYDRFWDYDSENGWYSYTDITHWMPIPELP